MFFPVLSRFFKLHLFLLFWFIQMPEKFRFPDSWMHVYLLIQPHVAFSVVAVTFLVHSISTTCFAIFLVHSVSTAWFLGLFFIFYFLMLSWFFQLHVPLFAFMVCSNLYFSASMVHSNACGIFSFCCFAGSVNCMFYCLAGSFYCYLSLFLLTQFTPLHTCLLSQFISLHRWVFYVVVFSSSDFLVHSTACFLFFSWFIPLHGVFPLVFHVGFCFPGSSHCMFFTLLSWFTPLQIFLLPGSFHCMFFCFPGSFSCKFFCFPGSFHYTFFYLSASFHFKGFLLPGSFNNTFFCFPGSFLWVFFCFPRFIRFLPSCSFNSTLFCFLGSFHCTYFCFPFSSNCMFLYWCCLLLLGGGGGGCGWLLFLFFSFL